MKDTKKYLALALSAVMALGMTACGDTENAESKAADSSKPAASSAAEESTPESEAVPESAAPAESKAESKAEEKPAVKEEKKDLKYLGEKDSEKCKYSVEITNGTDKTIIGFAIRYSDDEFGENLIPDGENFLADETRQLNYNHVVSGDNLVIGDYEVELTFEDETSFVLHGFPLTNMLSGEIRLMDDYAFLVYTNRVGDSKNTMESEEHAAEEARKAEEAKTATTTTTTTAQPETEPQTEAPTETQATEAPAVTEAPAETEAAQSPEGGCMGDDAFTF